MSYKEWKRLRCLMRLRERERAPDPREKTRPCRYPRSVGRTLRVPRTRATLQTAPRLRGPNIGSIEPSRFPEIVGDAFRASLIANDPAERWTGPLGAPWLVLGGEPRARAASSSDRIESGAWRWPCVAPLAGPSVGVVDRKRGENIGEVVGSLVTHQSSQE